MGKRSRLEWPFQSFLKAAGEVPGAAPQRLLRAIRALALDQTADDEVPNTLGLDDVVREAARLAARSNPERPLPQDTNKKLLWGLFRDLGAAGAGRAWMGRRGTKTRFEFSSKVTCRDLRLALDGAGIQPASKTGPTIARRETLAPAPSQREASATAKSLDRDTVVALLRANEQRLHELGVATLSLFGSVARNQARPDSDVDLVATFREPITSDMFFATKFFLEDLLGRPVDLLTDAAVRDRVRKAIEAELVRVA